MRIIFKIQSTDDEGNPTSNHVATAIELPRGCGRDNATMEIDKIAAQIKRIALEIYDSETEGREMSKELLRTL